MTNGEKAIEGILLLVQENEALRSRLAMVEAGNQHLQAELRRVQDEAAARQEPGRPRAAKRR